jgi:DNA-binding MarR family transcriptional regulator
MSDDFAQCMVTNSRMAARAITRRYDRHLRGRGITSTQLSLMAAIRQWPQSTVSELAERRGFDRTTLTRNLDRLEEMALVESHPAEKGNGRICTVTPKGRALMAELLPLWREAQAEMRQLLSEDGFDLSLSTLKRLAEV